MFDSPWYLLLLLALPVLAWRLFTNRRGAIAFTSLRVVEQIKPTLRQRLTWLPAALTLASIAVAIVAMARPREGREQTIVDSQGIAIELVVDRSGSMQAMDFQIDDQHVDRLTAIKKVAADFVTGNADKDLDGRFSDLIGLITFAGHADGETPPTLDHTFLVAQLNQARIVSQRSEDGTAIGDAVALAVEKLNALDTRQREKVKSKVIILLTDGENNAGKLEPIQAAELAQTLDIKVYTIGVGTRGQAPVPVTDVFGRQRLQYMAVNIDEATLTKVAEATGGKYFRATDTDSLASIYAEIDQLEKTKVEAKHFVDYRELAVQSYAGVVNIPPLFLIAFGLLATRWLLQQTWLRELA